MSKCLFGLLRKIIFYEIYAVFNIQVTITRKQENVFGLDIGSV